jgi:predicted TIM-barrel fold metal-dependent hydrolase
MSTVIDFRVRLPQELRPFEELPPELREQYEVVLGLDEKSERTRVDLEMDMRAAGIDQAVVHAEYEYGDSVDQMNEAVASLVGERPDLFYGMGTVSLTNPKISTMVNQIRRIDALGLVGVNIQPSFFGLSLDARELYPVYARAEELGLITCLHTGVNYTANFPIKNDHPLSLDQVACDFPNLKLVACHAGWPWVTELVAVLRKHRNVYAEFGGLAPKYVFADGAGWEVMRRMMNSVLAGQVLFGTDWPVYPQPAAVEEWKAGGLKPHVFEALMGQNALSLLSVAD